jgi:diguanylate cyclase (GGDEF)-like protein
LQERHHNPIGRFAHSIVTRLMLAGLVVLAAGTVITYLQLSRFLREDLTRVVSAQQLAMARYVASDIDQSVSDRLHLLERLAQALAPELPKQPQALQAWLIEQNDLRPAFSSGLLLAHRDGSVGGDSSRGPGHPGGSVVDDPSFRTALAGQSVIGRPSQATRPAEAFLTIAVPVRSTSGDVTAVLMGRSTLSAGGFLGRLLAGRIGDTGGLLLISPADRLFVASTDPRMLLTPTPASGINLLHDRAMAGFRGTGTTVNAFGVEEISAIASVPSTGWFVVARLPLSEALGTLTRTRAFIFSQRVPVMLAVLVLVGCAAAWLLRPLRRAAEQADKMARGELALTPLPVVRQDELGHLTSAFNRLLAKLDENRNALALLAHHDSLTGLPNRKLLADRLQQALARAQRHDTRVALLFLDLDGFKRINDNVGHEAGDEVLKQVAARLSGVVRQSDTVARLGGDEFVLLADDLGSNAEESACRLAQKCIDALTAPLPLRDTSHVLGVSIGIALSSGRDDADELLAAADRAMYAVKRGESQGYRLATVPS